MVRRSKLEIDMAVLEALSETDKPTRVMYKANLSWTGIQETFSRLISAGLIEVQVKGKSKRYRRTKSGNRALSHYYTLTGLRNKVVDTK